MCAPGIRALCSKRWTVRADSLQGILANVETLLSVWEEALEYVKDSDMKARIRGVSTHLRNFDTQPLIFSLLPCSVILFSAIVTI